MLSEGSNLTGSVVRAFSPPFSRLASGGKTVVSESERWLTKTAAFKPLFEPVFSSSCLAGLRRETSFWMFSMVSASEGGVCPFLLSSLLWFCFDLSVRAAPSCFSCSQCSGLGASCYGSGSGYVYPKLIIKNDPDSAKETIIC
jgi:hypothetical protein